MIKFPPVKKAANIFVSRLIPGAISVFALLMLATWLSRESYGIASTYIATASAAADLLFGPIIHSTLVHYSEHRARGDHRKFEALHLTHTLVLAAAVAVPGLALVWVGLLDWRIVAAVVAFGAHTSIQEIAHARLQFYRFAIGSGTQSLVFLGLAYILVRPDPTVWNAIEAFAISYAAGALVSAALIGPRLTRPHLASLKEAFSLGIVPTVSNLCVSGFNLGCRYLLLLFGRSDLLGIFAFSIDIAQRGVGIFLNLATFALVPHALKKSEKADAEQLWSSLRRGWAAAVIVAVSGAAAIMLLAASQMVPPLNRPVYDAVSFGLVCLAVILYRSSKMVLSPVAMRLRRTSVLLKPILFIAPVGLGLLALGLQMRVPYAVELVYSLTFAAWAATSYRLLVPQLRRQSEPMAA